MADAFVAYEPLDMPKPIGDDIWIVDGHEVAMRVFGFPIPFPTRMTIVRLPDGELWVHSPVAADDALYVRIGALGPVAHLVAPNSLHWSFIAEWRRAFPSAAVHIVPGLEPHVAAPRHVLTDAAPEAWSGTIRQRLVCSRALTEAVFFHSGSGTLIVTDLIENFEPSRIRSPLWRRIIRWAGAADPDGKAPIDLRATFRGHRRELRAAVQEMLDWAPRQIVLSHGRCYQAEAVMELRRAFRWVLPDQSVDGWRSD